jgi:deoxyribodipyrimidine photolyase-related protein
MALTLILGNQLFPEWTSKSVIQLGSKDTVLMIEDAGIASRFQYHKSRILHTFVAMREFKDHLESCKIKVRYFSFDLSLNTPFLKRLEEELSGHSELRVARIPDRSFRSELEGFCKKKGLKVIELQSPQFLCGEEEFKAYLKNSKRPFMKTFYERERKRLGILVDKAGAPVGGQWSFDSENRKKTPKNYQEPALPKIKPSPHEKTVREWITRHLDHHPGTLSDRFLPTNRDDALMWLDRFLKDRLEDFGPYEDAISSRFQTLNHSILSPLINLGLLNPAEVVQKTIAYAKAHD